MKLDPFAIAVLLTTAGLYTAGCLRVRPPRSELGAFAAGWLTLAAALLSPIATISEVLFSVHMTQHELLMLVAAPLLAFGRPIVPMLRALPLGWRQRVGRLGVTPAGAWLMAPAPAFALHAAALWVWHLPVLYDAAVQSDSIHLAQHLCFTGTASLFWWTVLRGRHGRLGYGAAVIYVFATALHSSGLGALLTFASRPMYPLYAERAHLDTVDPLADQQLAGLLMWIPAGVVLLIVALLFFAAWLGEAGRRQAIR